MMKILNEIGKYQLSIQKIEWFPNYALLYCNDKTYIYRNHSFEKEKSQYLDRIHFIYYYKRENSETDDFDLFLLEDNSISPLEILFCLYDCSKEDVILSEEKKNRIGTKCENNIKESLNYYYSLQDSIEEMLFPRLNYYKLLLQMSNIYQLLNLGLYFVNTWKKGKNDTYADTLNLKNIQNDNFVGGKIIDISASHRDLLVFELANLVKTNYVHKSYIKEIDNYIENNLEENEKLLFYALISYIEEIDNEEEISSKLLYLSTILPYLSEKYKKYQERENEVL